MGECCERIRRLEAIEGGFWLDFGGEDETRIAARATDESL